MSPHIDLVFDGPPSHEGARFIEVENAAGQSVSFGTWVRRPDGYWCLRIDLEAELEKSRRHVHVAGTTVGKDIDECAVCGHDIRHDIHSSQ